MDRSRTRYRGARLLDSVYLHCAVHFGFPKSVVDGESALYINNLLVDFFKENEKMQKDQERSMRSINKRLR